MSGGLGDSTGGLMDKCPVVGGRKGGLRKRREEKVGLGGNLCISARIGL